MSESNLHTCERAALGWQKPGKCQQCELEDNFARFGGGLGVSESPKPNTTRLTGAETQDEYREIVCGSNSYAGSAANISTSTTTNEGGEATATRVTSTPTLAGIAGRNSSSEPPLRAIEFAREYYGLEEGSKIARDAAEFAEAYASLRCQEVERERRDNHCKKCGQPLASGLTDDGYPEGCTEFGCQHETYYNLRERAEAAEKRCQDAERERDAAQDGIIRDLPDDFWKWSLEMQRGFLWKRCVAQQDLIDIQGRATSQLQKRDEQRQKWANLALSLQNHGIHDCDWMFAELDKAVTESVAVMRQRAESAERRVAELTAELQGLIAQITNTRLCHFGDHTGHEVQFETDQIERLRKRLSEVERPEEK